MTTTVTSTAGTSWTRASPLNRPAVIRVVGGGAVLFAIWTVLGLAYTRLLDDGPVGDADRRISEWFERNRTASWDTWSNSGSMLWDTLTKVALIVVVGGIMIAAWRRWHDGVFLAVVVIVESSAFALSGLVIVATSRVYRGMHHVSDVIAGFLLGLASLLVVHMALVVGVRELDRRAERGRTLPPQIRTLVLDHHDADHHHHDQGAHR